MRYPFYILCLIVLLVGCSKPADLQEGHSDVIPGSYIFFDAGVVGTKADNQYEEEELPNRARTAFGVFGSRANGSPVFDTYSKGSNSQINNMAIVYKTSAHGSYIYDNLALWHNGQHNFYAYYIQGLEYTKRNNGDNYAGSWGVIDDMGTHTINGTIMPYARYVHPLFLDEMKDVMTASTTATPASGDVILDFKHRLFALDIELKNVSDNPMIIKSASVGIPVYTNYYLYFDGSVEADTQSVEKSVEYVFFNELVQVESNNSLKLNQAYAKTNTGYYTFLLIPCETLEINVRLTFTNTWGEDYPWESQSVTVEGGFQAGKQYTLFVRRSDDNGTEVEFSAYVAEKDANGNDGNWNTVPDVDHTFN